MFLMLYHLFITVFAIRSQTLVFTVGGRGRGSEETNTENSCFRDLRLYTFAPEALVVLATHS